MKQETKVPRFAHLQYTVLHDLEISINEYFLLDMIHHLSGSGRYWCNKKLDNIASDMKLTKRGVTKIRDRLIERKLLLKGVGNRLRTSEKVNKVYFLDADDYKKSELSSKKVNLVQSKSELSSVKLSVENNKRLTKNKNTTELSNEERKKARQTIASLKQQFLNRKTVN